MIKNKKLLIDTNCPMCKIYGETFTRFGMIDKKTVYPYQFANASFTKNIDMDRAKSEIALHDTRSNRTVYGIDAFIEILCQEKSILRWLANLKPVYFLAKTLYLFISYNRKIIAPPQLFCTGKSCTPPFNLGYRLSYILLSALFTGFVLFQYFQPVFKSFNIPYYPGFEYLVCFGQILWQGLVIHHYHKDQFWEYLGNMSTVSNIGVLLLIPAFVIYSILELSSFYALFAFAIVVGIILLEHLSRTRKLSLSGNLTLSWVGYRIFVLTVFTILNYLS